MGVELVDALAATQSPQSRICLDDYEATLGLWEAIGSVGSIALAGGSERGWTKGERNQFREHGFTLAHLGDRPQRVETATIVSIGIAIARMPR